MAGPRLSGWKDHPLLCTILHLNLGAGKDLDTPSAGIIPAVGLRLWNEAPVPAGCTYPGDGKVGPAWINGMGREPRLHFWGRKGNEGGWDKMPGKKKRGFAGNAPEVLPVGGASARSRIPGMNRRGQPVSRPMMKATTMRVCPRYTPRIARWPSSALFERSS